MMHLNPNDDRENSLENMRELTENSYHDVFVYYHGKQYLIYSDPGATTIDTDEDYFWFKDYDEMIKAPVFEFKTLEEIIDEIDATY